MTCSAEGQKGRTCLVCGVTFAALDEQRSHFKSDWHRLNVRRKLRGLSVLSEEDAARLIDDGVSSISGSGVRYPLHDGLSNHIIREAARAIVKGLPSSHNARTRWLLPNFLLGLLKVTLPDSHSPELALQTRTRTIQIKDTTVHYPGSRRQYLSRNLRVPPQVTSSPSGTVSFFRIPQACSRAPCPPAQSAAPSCAASQQNTEHGL